jgi:hypothetical protein
LVEVAVVAVVLLLSAVAVVLLSAVVLVLGERVLALCPEVVRDP